MWYDRQILQNERKSGTDLNVLVGRSNCIHTQHKDNEIYLKYELCWLYIVNYRDFSLKLSIFFVIPFKVRHKGILI